MNNQKITLRFIFPSSCISVGAAELHTPSLQFFSLPTKDDDGFVYKSYTIFRLMNDDAMGDGKMVEVPTIIRCFADKKAVFAPS